jgi:radical SAM enzyme (TIGR04100 family)
MEYALRNFYISWDSRPAEKRKRKMEILYKVHNNIYVNLTNKCPCACTFCLRQTKDHVGESGRLWLEREPSAEEVIAEFAKWDVNSYDEVVFCGFGEPTEAFDTLKKVAAYVKETYNKPIRINTNGLGNLINNRDITPELRGLVDTVSISLNTPNADRYHELVKSKFGDKSYDAMLDFARNCTKYIPNVVMTTVATTLSAEEEEQCKNICETLGVKYRIRPWE